MPMLSKIWEYIFGGGDNFMLRKTDISAWEHERFQRLHDMVAKKAYELYEKRNYQHGHDMEDWVEAERLIKRHVRLRDR